MANKLQILGKRVRFFFTSLNGARSVARNFLPHRAQDFFARIKQMSRDEEERCCFRDTFRQRKIFRALHFAERKPTGFFSARSRHAAPITAAHARALPPKDKISRRPTTYMKSSGARAEGTGKNEKADLRSEAPGQPLFLNRLVHRGAEAPNGN